MHYNLTGTSRRQKQIIILRLTKKELTVMIIDNGQWKMENWNFEHNN